MYKTKKTLRLRYHNFPFFVFLYHCGLFSKYSSCDRQDCVCVCVCMCEFLNVSVGAFELFFNKYLQSLAFIKTWFLARALHLSLEKKKKNCFKVRELSMRRLVVKENLIGSAKPPVNRQTSCFFIYGGIITTQGVKKMHCHCTILSFAFCCHPF